MIDDPIVAEVRRARHKHAADFDFDLHQIFADLQRTEKGRDRSESPLLRAPEKSTIPPKLDIRRARFARR